MELESINKLFLELSQITTAKTKRELELESKIAAVEPSAADRIRALETGNQALLDRVRELSSSNESMKVKLVEDFDRYKRQKRLWQAAVEGIVGYTIDWKNKDAVTGIGQALKDWAAAMVHERDDAAHLFREADKELNLAIRKIEKLRRDGVAPKKKSGKGEAKRKAAH